MKAYRYSCTHVLALLGCCTLSYPLNSRLCVLLSRLAIKPWFLSSPLHSLMTTQAELSCCNCKQLICYKYLSAYSPAFWILEQECYLSIKFIVTYYLLSSAPKISVLNSLFFACYYCSSLTDLCCRLCFVFWGQLWIIKNCVILQCSEGENQGFLAGVCSHNIGTLPAKSKSVYTCKPGQQEGSSGVTRKAPGTESRAHDTRGKEGCQNGEEVENSYRRIPGL